MTSLSAESVSLDTASKTLGKDVVVGDIITFLGTPHRVGEIEDYSHNPWGFEGWRIAKSANGWGITLDPDQRYEVG